MLAAGFIRRIGAGKRSGSPNNILENEGRSDRWARYDRTHPTPLPQLRHNRGRRVGRRSFCPPVQRWHLPGGLTTERKTTNIGGHATPVPTTASPQLRDNQNNQVGRVGKRFFCPLVQPQQYTKTTHHRKKPMCRHLHTFSSSPEGETSCRKKNA
jgi:hypothetical protein